MLLGASWDAIAPEAAGALLLESAGSPAESGSIVTWLMSSLTSIGKRVVPSLCKKQEPAICFAKTLHTIALTKEKIIVLKILLPPGSGSSLAISNETLWNCH